jgi:exosortase/archaeosortase
VLWNKSVPWILLPFTLLYLANAGTSLICQPIDLSLTCLALSILVIYGNGWAHKDTFPTLAVTLAYEWMWFGSQSFRYCHSAGTASHMALTQRTSSSPR